MDKVLHHSVRLRCDPQRAFEWFTVDQLLERWLSVEADVEPRVGGTYELFWDPADRENNSTIGCRITAMAEGKVLAFQWKGPVQFKDFMNDADPLTHVAVFLLPIQDGAEPLTEVHVIHSGWRPSDAWQEARRFFKGAWEDVLRDLQEAVRAWA